MNYRKIIDNIGKYHFLFSTDKKSMLFSSNNIYNEALNKTLGKIKSKLSKLQGKQIVYIKLKKIKDDDIKQNKKSKIKFIGGVIVTIIKIYNINDKGELIIDNKEDRHNKVYFSKKFFDDNEEITTKDLKKIAYHAINRKLKSGLMDINVYNKI